MELRGKISACAGLRAALALLNSTVLVLGSASPVTAASALPDLSAHPLAIPALRLAPPADIGRVTDFSDGIPDLERSPFVILVQDLHANYGVQRNIADLLEFLAKELKGSKEMPFALAMEGADGLVRHPILTDYPDEKIRSITLDYLMREAEISGAEAFAIQNGGGLPLYGVEDDKLFQANRDVFVLRKEARDEAFRILESIQARIAEETLRHVRYAPPLKSFLARERAHDNGRMSVQEWMEVLAKEATQLGIDTKTDFPALAPFMRNANAAAASPELLQQQRVQFIQAASPRWSAEERKTLSALAKRSSIEAYDLYLRELIHLHRQFMEVPEVLARTLEYRYALQTAGMDRIQFESRQLAQRIKLARGFEASQKSRRRLARDTPEFIQVEHDVDLVKRILRFQATENEVRAFVPRMDAFLAIAKSLLENAGEEQSARRLRVLLSGSVEYYVLAMMRNQPMVDHTLALITGPSAKTNVAVLVTGGFHTQPIAQLLRQRGVPYLVITPHVARLDPDDHKRYEARLLGQPLSPAQMISDARRTHSSLAEAINGSKKSGRDRIRTASRTDVDTNRPTLAIGARLNPVTTVTALTVVTGTVLAIDMPQAFHQHVQPAIEALQQTPLIQGAIGFFSDPDWWNRLAAFKPNTADSEITQAASTIAALPMLSAHLARLWELFKRLFVGEPLTTRVARRLDIEYRRMIQSSGEVDIPDFNPYETHFWENRAGFDPAEAAAAAELCASWEKIIRDKWRELRPHDPTGDEALDKRRDAVALFKVMADALHMMDPLSNRATSDYWQSVYSRDMPAWSHYFANYPPLPQLDPKTPRADRELNAVRGHLLRNVPAAPHIARRIRNAKVFIVPDNDNENVRRYIWNAQLEEPTILIAADYWNRLSASKKTFILGRELGFIFMEDETASIRLEANSGSSENTAADPVVTLALNMLSEDWTADRFGILAMKLSGADPKDVEGLPLARRTSEKAYRSMLDKQTPLKAVVHLATIDSPLARTESLRLIRGLTNRPDPGPRNAAFGDDDFSNEMFSPLLETAFMWKGDKLRKPDTEREIKEELVNALEALKGSDEWRKLVTRDTTAGALQRATSSNAQGLLDALIDLVRRSNFYFVPTPSGLFVSPAETKKGSRYASSHYGFGGKATGSSKRNVYFAVRPDGLSRFELKPRVGMAAHEMVHLLVKELDADGKSGGLPAHDSIGIHQLADRLTELVETQLSRGAATTGGRTAKAAFGQEREKVVYREKYDIDAIEKALEKMEIQLDLDTLVTFMHSPDELDGYEELSEPERSDIRRQYLIASELAHLLGYSSIEEMLNPTSDPMKPVFQGPYGFPSTAAIIGKIFDLSGFPNETVSDDEGPRTLRTTIAHLLGYTDRLSGTQTVTAQESLKKAMLDLSFHYPRPHPFLKRTARTDKQPPFFSSKGYPVGAVASGAQFVGGVFNSKGNPSVTEYDTFKSDFNNVPKTSPKPDRDPSPEKYEGGPLKSPVWIVDGNFGVKVWNSNGVLALQVFKMEKDQIEPLGSPMTIAEHLVASSELELKGDLVRELGENTPIFVTPDGKVRTSDTGANERIVGKIHAINFTAAPVGQSDLQITVYLDRHLKGKVGVFQVADDGQHRVPFLFQTHSVRQAQELRQTLKTQLQVQNAAEIRRAEVIRLVLEKEKFSADPEELTKFLQPQNTTSEAELAAAVRRFVEVKRAAIAERRQMKEESWSVAEKGLQSDPRASQIPQEVLANWKNAFLKGAGTDAETFWKRQLADREQQTVGAWQSLKGIYGSAAIALGILEDDLKYLPMLDAEDALRKGFSLESNRMDYARDIILVASLRSVNQQKTLPAKALLLLKQSIDDQGGRVKDGDDLYRLSKKAINDSKGGGNWFWNPSNPRASAVYAVLGAFIVETFALLKALSGFQEWAQIHPLAFAVLAASAFLVPHFAQLSWNGDASMPLKRRTNALTKDVAFMTGVTFLAGLLIGTPGLLAHDTQSIVIVTVSLIHFALNYVRNRNEFREATQDWVRQARHAGAGIPDGISSLIPSAAVPPSIRGRDSFGHYVKEFARQA